jgi:hypothetical protein
MTTQVDTVVLAGRLFSGEGSSLQDATAIRISEDKIADTLPIERQSAGRIASASCSRVSTPTLALQGNPLEDITRLQDPQVVMKGGCVAVDNRVNASA